MDFPGFIWIRNEAQQRKPIRHHFPLLRTGCEWLLRTPFIKAHPHDIAVVPLKMLNCTTAGHESQHGLKSPGPDSQGE